MAKNLKNLLSLCFALPIIAYGQTNTFPSTGNVGIGTTAPSEKLEVFGNAKFLTGDHKLYINELSSFDPLKAGFRNNAGNLVINAKDGGVLYLNRDVNSETRIQSAFGATTVDIATFKANGDVGIGTTTPNAKLEVLNQSATMPVLRIRGSATQNIGSSLIDIISNSASTVGAHFIRSGNNVEFQLKATADGSIQTSLANTGSYTLGTLSVGTTDSKGYTFAVNGDAMFTRIKVKQYGAWPDYVFTPTYRLPSLNEVEAFIQQYRHLPDVPSACEVEREGLDISENQAILLRKVEELTLYAIQSDKMNQALELQNQQQAELLKSLAERISKLEERIK